MQQVEFFPVIVTERPTDADHAPLTVNPAAARIARAGDLVEGDLVLAQLAACGPGLERAEYFTDPYPAQPRPVDAACCQMCADTVDDGPSVVITDGFPWDVCDVWPALGLALVIPAAT